MMYGREPLLPWQMENDLGPLDMSQEVPQVSIEEAIEKMENLHQQVLEVAAGNIKKAQAHQAKTYLAKILCATVIGHGSGTLLVETNKK